jgi:DNA-binding MarR family transcriptional regulator
MSTDSFDNVLGQWVNVFMTRSHHDLMRYLRTADLSIAQYGTLMRLFKDAHCGVGDIASQLSVSNAAASQMVDKLVQHGLVERTEDPHDRRAKRLSLTPKGHRILERSRDARLAWTRDLVNKLDPERRAAIVTALEHLIVAAQDTETAEDGRGAEISTVKAAK